MNTFDRVSSIIPQLLQATHSMYICCSICIPCLRVKNKSPCLKKWSRLMYIRKHPFMPYQNEEQQDIQQPSAGVTILPALQ